MRILAASLVVASWSVAVADNVASPFLAQLEQGFSAWDRNHNQALDLGEIDQAIASPTVKSAAAATVVALRRGLRSAKLDSVTLDSARAATEKRRVDQKALPDFGGLFNWGTKKLQRTQRAMFANPVPRIETMKQGKLGDCFCLAALRVLLQRDPLAIKRMIQAQPDGSYRVRIGDRDVRTPALTDGEIILGASTADGLWPIIYEKAVGVSLMKSGAEGATPFNVVTRGGSAGGMMSTLTAHEIKRWSCKVWREASDDKAKQEALLADLRQELTSAFQTKRLVTCGTATLSKGKSGVPGMTYNHGYAVLGYDAAKDEVRLWNPHGDEFRPKGPAGLQNGYPRTRGEFSVPTAEVTTFMSGFAFEQLPPPLVPPQP